MAATTSRRSRRKRAIELPAESLSSTSKKASLSIKDDSKKDVSSELDDSAAQPSHGNCKKKSKEGSEVISPTPPRDTSESPGSAANSASPDDGQDDITSRLQFSFFDCPCEELAAGLLGKRLVRRLPGSGEMLSGIIVETEAYLGGLDKGSHSYNGKRTARNEAMYMAAGTAYVYHIYGAYTCLNISSRGDGAAVLIRGLEAERGLETMRSHRGAKRADGGAGLKDRDLCNGPSKLTQALQIGKVDADQRDLTAAESSIWLEDGRSVPEADVVRCPRIGIDYAGEWVKVPLRFYVRGSRGVSVRDKAAEAAMDKGPPDEVRNTFLSKLKNESGSTSHTASSVLETSQLDTNTPGLTDRKEYSSVRTRAHEQTVVKQDNSTHSLETCGKRSFCSHRQGPVHLLSQNSQASAHDCVARAPCCHVLRSVSDTSTLVSHTLDRQSQSSFSPTPDVLSRTTVLHVDSSSMSHGSSVTASHIGSRLQFDFYNRPGLQLARSLLGQTLVRITEDGQRLVVRIVETEAYLGQEDPCCHSYGKKPTAKTKSMFMPPGTAYVYNVYYSYCCVNISCEGEGAVVLIRAAEPVEGLSFMREQRGRNLKSSRSKLKDHQLTNGPSKLCMALTINRASSDGIDLVSSDCLWLEAQPPVPDEDVGMSARVGLGEHLPEEARQSPWRFYIRNSPSISVKDVS